jgi:hypothetical protein
MKKILIYGIFCFTFLGFEACKKTELSPKEQLNNTFWTGFFNYEPLKDGFAGLELIQPFAIELLANGNINWYEALGNSGGKWVLIDQTITITQDNKNIITLSYIDGIISFVKIVGPPAKWTATNIEKYNPEMDKPTSNTAWLSGGGGTVNLIEVNSNPRLDWGPYKDVPIEVKNNMILANNGGFGFAGRGAFMIIRNNKMYFIFRSAGSLFPSNHTKK